MFNIFFWMVCLVVCFMFVLLLRFNVVIVDFNEFGKMGSVFEELVIRNFGGFLFFCFRDLMVLRYLRKLGGKLCILLR